MQHLSLKLYGHVLSNEACGILLPDNAVLAIHFIVRDILVVVSSVIRVGIKFIAKHAYKERLEFNDIESLTHALVASGTLFCIKATGKSES